MPTKKTMPAVLLMLCFAVLLAACGSGGQQPAPAAAKAPSSGADTGGTDMAAEQTPAQTASAAEPQEREVPTMRKMNVQVNGKLFTAVLEDNTAVDELTEMMRQAPVTIQMHDFSGFEKVGPLGRSLTAEDRQTTTSAGDIVLYNGDNIVVFYGSNSWSYTRIGRIDDLTGWADALGGANVDITFSLPE